MKIKLISIDADAVLPVFGPAVGVLLSVILLLSVGESHTHAYETQFM